MKAKQVHSSGWLRAVKVMIFCVLLMSMVWVYRADVQAASSYTEINVTAEEIEENGIRIAIQTALDTAKESASDTEPYMVIVESGSYTMTDSLYIYSNTYLCMDGVTLTQTAGDNSNMIKIGDLNDESTGYYYENITIDGGIWDENGNGNTLIKLAHASNVTVKNATFENVENAHLMEVAGINGLYITGCTFKDQELTLTDETVATNEAIQLDILVSDHFNGYLSEDLALQDVEISGCTFSNVPRGVGSHTGVINNPIDGLTITGNTFEDLTSCGIQLMAVKNCTISDNTMTDVPRGIYIYSYVWSGTYTGSVLYAEDEAGSATSSTYQTPTSSGIVISGNSISMSGTDEHADYENAGIWLQGFSLTADKKYNGGTVSAGNYYLTGITVQNNTIKTTGFGIRMADVYSSTISGNTITGPGTSSSSFYGISTLKESKKNTISSNTIKKFYRGIYIYGSSTASAVTGNTISSIGNTGIWIADATVTKVTTNTVSSPSANGIYVADDASVTYIKSNEITSAGKNAIMTEDATVKYIQSNTISSPANNGIYVYSSSSVSYIKSNKISSTGKYGVAVESSTASYIQSNTISKAANYSVYIYKSKVKTLSSNTISNGSKRAVFVSGLKSDLTIKSNTISKSGTDYLIYLNPGTTSYTITVSSNTLTGASKKPIGVRADSGKVVLKSNTIKSCSYAAQFTSSVKGTIYKNTLSSNKYNKYKIGSSTIGNLSAPTVTVGTKTKSSIKLSWSKVSSGTGYQIYRATSKSGTYKKVKTISSASTVSYTNKNLTKSKTYYYKIRAYKKFSNTTVYGSFSSVKSGKTLSK